MKEPYSVLEKIIIFLAAILIIWGVVYLIITYHSIGNKESTDTESESSQSSDEDTEENQQNSDEETNDSESDDLNSNQNIPI